MKVQALAKALNDPPGKIAVWFSTTGKKLTRKMAPGLYSAYPEMPEKNPEENPPRSFDNPNLMAAIALEKKEGKKFSVVLVQRQFKLGYQAACELHDLVIDAKHPIAADPAPAKKKGGVK